MSSSTNLPPAQYIDTTDALDQLVKTLASESLLAIDTESNSLHAYQERVCLIQISSRTQDYIIDPLAIDDVQPLNRLLRDPNIEKVFHAAEYDIMCLKRDYGFEINNLFDTMIAARICGYKQVGLNNLVMLHLGVAMDKTHQRDNWGERPLPVDCLRYAQADTHFLPALRDLLYQELAQRGHLEEAQETFQEMTLTTPAHDGRTFNPDGYWKIGQPNRLNMVEMGVLRELYLLRESAAEKFDMPPFKIFTNQTLVDLARAMPSSPSEMPPIRGMSPAQIRRYGRQIIEAVQRGRNSQLPEPPNHFPPPPEISERYIALHTWRKEKAIQRGVESDIIVSKHTLWDLAQKTPTTKTELHQIEGLGPWRLQTYGDELLHVIAQTLNQP